MTTNFSVRISDEDLLVEIKQYAETQKVAESTAIVRLLREGKQAREGKPIQRFACIDPKSDQLFSVLLGELRLLEDILRKTKAALARPRPVNNDEAEQWEKDKKAASNSLTDVEKKVKQIRDVGKMSALLYKLSNERLMKAKELLSSAEKNTPLYEVHTLLGMILPPHLPSQQRTLPVGQSEKTQEASAVKELPKWLVSPGQHNTEAKA